jgi:hypothetical protein
MFDQRHLAPVDTDPISIKSTALAPHLVTVNDILELKLEQGCIDAAICHEFAMRAGFDQAPFVQDRNDIRVHDR